jgi:hypothetical protein
MSGTASGSPSSQPRPAAGPEIGLRAGVGLFSYGTKFFSSQLQGGFPLWLDIGYRTRWPVYIGVFAQAAPLVIAGDEGDCHPYVHSCSGWDYRFGLNAQYRFLPDDRFDPWMGLGFGYEFFDYSAIGIYGDPRSNQVSADKSGRGPEFANLQAGLSLQVANRFWMGPFALLSIGRFDWVTDKLTGEELVAMERGHHWLMFGVSGTYDP